MNNQFEELALGSIRSVSPRQGLKKFRLGPAGMMLIWLGAVLPTTGQTVEGYACYVRKPLLSIKRKESL